MKIRMARIDELTPDPENANSHDEAGIERIAESYERFGQQKPIVVDADGIVRAGNGQLEAAKRLGWQKIAIVETKLTGAEATAFAIADNRSGEFSQWNSARLASALEDLQAESRELLEATGFDQVDLDAMLESLGTAPTGGGGIGSPEATPVEIVEDEAPEPPADPITKPGDLWILGDHRLLCGDSTNADDVARLMDGAKADLCFTSPPYALGASVSLSGNKSMSQKGNAYDSHKDDAAGWLDLMRSWFDASSEIITGGWVVNVQPLAGNKRDLFQFVVDNLSQLADVATWDKQHAAPAMAAGVMSSRFEWLLIFSNRQNAPRTIPCASWRGTVQNVYVAPPQRGNEFSEIHAATMPVHLAAWVIETLCDQSFSVYEPFCGTGTTLIAAEQLGRKCYGMEISPQYCDVIVKRWEALTGETAVRQ